jgi:hypothetical protein
LPRKKFNREQANRIWKSYTANLINSISEAESEGLERGYSSYQIELLWQEKVKQKTQKILERNEVNKDLKGQEENTKTS